MSKLQLTSQAFEEGDMIPAQFTCEGDNVSPPLTIDGVPEDAKTLVLIVVDPDIPEEVKDSMGIDVFDHWVAYNITANTTHIESGEAVGMQGSNSSGETGYTGPCPPAQYEPTEHQYVFRLHALDTRLDLSPGASRAAVEQAMEGSVLDEAELVGRYEKQQG